MRYDWEKAAIVGIIALADIGIWLAILWSLGVL